MLVYCLDDIMQIRLSEPEVADTLNPLVRYMLAGGRRSMPQNFTDCCLRNIPEATVLEILQSPDLGRF